MKESVEAGFRKEFEGRDKELLFALGIKVAISCDNPDIEDKDLSPLSRELRLIREQMLMGGPTEDDKVAKLIASNA